MQLVLLIEVFYYIGQTENNSGGFTARMHQDVMVTRLVCAFLMHMASEPEIRQSLAMFKYVLNHTKDRTSII